MRAELMQMKHLVAGGVLFLFPLMVFAETPAVSNFKGSLNAAAGVSGLQTIASPGVIAGNLINVILGISGIALFCLLAYAGVLYMQGGSDEGKIKQAKGLIVNAIIGIVLVLSAYAISQFVLDALTRVAAGTPSS